MGPSALDVLKGGRVASQIGVRVTNLILLVMNDRGMQSIFSSKVKLRADASVAGAPKVVMPPQIRTPGYELRFSVTRTPTACLPESPSRAKGFVQTITQMNGSMATPLRHRKS
jgi:hypothetical protein